MRPATPQAWAVDISARVGASDVVMDLGGVLLTGGVMAARTEATALADLAKDLGADPAAAAEAWFALQPPVEAGELPEAVLWDALAALSETGMHADDVRELIWAAVRVNPFAISVLLELRARGVPVHLASNHLESWLDLWRSRFAFMHEFSSCTSSEGARARKPDPRFFHALARHVAGPGAVFVDDRLVNVRAAVDHGYRGIWAVTPDEWRWHTSGGSG